MSPRSNRKTSTWSAVNLKKHVTSMSCRLEPAIWSHDTGKQIPCFDRCQLLITWMFNIKEVHGKPRLHVFCQPIIWNMAAMCDSTVAVVRTRPRAILLPMITMRKSIHGFLFPYMVMELRMKTLWAAGAPLLPQGEGGKLPYEKAGFARHLLKFLYHGSWSYLGCS